MDVGIMPLFDDPWARGKCAMKAIQYMGVGLPAVVSPVGANRDVVQDGVSGFHAATEEEWVRALERLLDDGDLRHSHGSRGPAAGRGWILGRGAGASRRSAAEEPPAMTSLLDGLLALLLAGFLNLLVLYQIRARAEPAEAGFLVRVYVWTILLRYSLAIVLNVFAANSAFAAAFWGDSGSYDIGGYQLALKWSGEPITTVYMSRAVSGYGWVYFVGVDLLRLRPQPAPRPVPQRPDRRPHRPRHLRDRGQALRPRGGPVGRPLHGLLPADGLLVHRHVQGPGDPPVHRPGHVRGAEAARAAVSGA